MSGIVLTMKPSIGGAKLEQDPQASNRDTPPTTPPRTPTRLSSIAHELVTEIRSIYTTLAGLDDLSPQPQINTLLTRLVDLCVQTHSNDLTDYFFSLEGVEDLCYALRPLCATAEGELERHWAQRILDSSNQIDVTPASPQHSHTLLSAFPYHENYIDLSRLECSLLEAFLPLAPTTNNFSNTPSSPRNMAFIGSGPLPLTSFCMLDRYPSAVVHNIDRDESALDISQKLAKNLGYAGMRFELADVSDDANDARESNEELTQRKTDWQSLDVVFLAALVGMDSREKMCILQSLATKLAKGTLVVVRSARGLRGVLYPVLDISPLLQAIGFEILAEVHPWTKVVNSVVILKVR